MPGGSGASSTHLGSIARDLATFVVAFLATLYAGGSLLTITIAGVGIVRTVIQTGHMPWHLL